MDRAKVIFATSFGYYDPHVLAMAKKHPEVTFLHCGGLYDEKRHPKNVGTYFGFIDECQYVSGIVAGYTTKSKKLGFVAGKPIPQVLRNINAFTLGAPQRRPGDHLHGRLYRRLVAACERGRSDEQPDRRGSDVLTCHVNSPKVVIENRGEARNLFVRLPHQSGESGPAKAILTGAEWCWGKVYTDYVAAIQAGNKVSGMVRGGLEGGNRQHVPLWTGGQRRPPQSRRRGQGEVPRGDFVIFKGPLKDNTGKVVIPAGKAYAQNAIELESMDYLVDGVSGR